MQSITPKQQQINQKSLRDALPFKFHSVRAINVLNQSSNKNELSIGSIRKCFV